MRYLTLLLFLFSFLSLSGQDCPPGDVTLHTQAQVDAFVANYPNCTTINGYLRIGDNVGEADAVTDIFGLSMLTQITGDLRIALVFHLPSLTGLEQLEAIGGDLRFDLLWERDTPLDISALDHTITIGGIVYFGDVNYPIPQIAPCGVQAVCDHYFLSPNNITSAYDACMPLSLVCQNPPTDCPTSDVTIESQAEADNFIQLYPNCTELDVSLLFRATEQEVNVTTGFANIKKINGGISATGCEVSGAFTALDTLMGSISARVGIGINNSYADGHMSSSFPNLKYISGTLEAYYDPEGYPSVSCSLPALTRIEGGFSSCNRAVNCIGCVNLEYIGGDIYTPVGGLNYVDTIMGTIDYQSCIGAFDNYVSSPTSGFDELKYLGGDLSIGGSQLQSFGDITGFAQLNTIVGSLYCFNDFNYTGNDYEITGLGQLKRAGSISISYYRLGNLDFLSQLESIDGGLSLFRNNRLTDISGLDHTISIGGGLFLKDNPQLSECALQAVCDHLESSGATTIENNMTGCDNVQEVLDECGIAPECPPSDVTLYTQADVDAFAANFPNCTTINGYLLIGADGFNEAVAITDISGLSMLTHITGDLRIDQVPHLPNLNGLEQLEAIGGNLSFDLGAGDALDVTALDHPITIGGVIYFLGSIGENPITPCNVQAICDHYLLSPDNIVSTYGTCGSLSQTCQPISECPNGNVIITSQEDMDYFAATYPNCTQINGNFTTTNDDTNVTINVPSLPQLQHISGTIGIGAHTILSANSFSALTQVDGGVHLSADIDGGFPVLESIGGSIVVFDGVNTGAGPTGGYPALKYIGGGISAGGAEGGYLNSNDFPLLERIEGGISGCGWGGEHDFSGFDNLRYIGGSITTQQGTISGMNMVDTIGGSIEFYKCYAAYIPVNITGLNQLKHIGGNLEFNNDHCLQDLSGLTQLNSIGGDLGITVQTGFACSTSTDSITGLAQLQHVGEDLILFESNLTNIDFLSQLQSIGNSLHIRSNSFDNLNALNHPISIGGELLISQNWNLSECAAQAVCDHLADNQVHTIENNLSGCNSSFEVQAACDPMLLCPSGDITLSTQEEIDAIFAAYPNCTQLLGKLIVRADNPADIGNLDALSQLTSTGGGLLIDNTAITNLNGLQNLTTTGYNLVITNNLNLTSLAGLENITSTASHLKIENNDALTDLSGLDNITQVGEGLLIFDNDNLQSLSGLNALTNIGSQLYLKSNINLTSLSGLESLTSIGTDIRIQGNSNLSSLNALLNLIAINGYIQITGNDALTSLMGLENIDPAGITQVTVSNNSNLSMCSASSVCGHITDNGSVTFSNNAEGCNNTEEVDTACQTFLPIEMTAPLRVYLKNEHAILEWRTATEVDNTGFEIQRSKDGIEWEKIGWQAGQGNTSTSYSYRYTDESPLFGTSYYRFKQVDFNGDIEYSNIVSLQYIRNGVTVYPNPVKEQLYLDIDNGFVEKITIYNSTGSEVAQITNPGNSLDVSTFPKGIYIIKIAIDDEDFYEKIIVE